MRRPMILQKGVVQFPVVCYKSAPLEPDLETRGGNTKGR